MLSVRIADGEVAGTDQLDDAHLVDVDAEGRVVGIDIMTLDDFKIDEMAERFGFSDHAPAIKAAIRDVLTPKTRGSWEEPIRVQGIRTSDVSTRTQTEDHPAHPLVPPIIA